MLVLMRRKGESILIYPGDIPEGMTVAELFAGGPNGHLDIEGSFRVNKVAECNNMKQRNPYKELF